MKIGRGLILGGGVALSMALFSALSGAALAADPPAASGDVAAINDLLTVFRNAAGGENGEGGWVPTLRKFASNLFWLLVSIELAWTAISMALRDSGLDEWLNEIVNKIIFIGFFGALLTWSQQWASAIISSFQSAALNVANNGTATQTATHTISDPGAVFGSAIALVSRILQSTQLTNGGSAEATTLLNVAVVVAAFIILFVLVGIAVSMFITLVESYIVIAASVLLTGFGGSTWTSEYARKILMYALSVGAKLFTLELIVSLGMQIINDLLAQVKPDVSFESQYMVIIAILATSIVFYVISKSIPTMVQALLNGDATQSGGQSFVSSGTTSSLGIAKSAVARSWSGALAAGAGRRLAAETATGGEKRNAFGLETELETRLGKGELRAGGGAGGPFGIGGSGTFGKYLRQMHAKAEREKQISKTLIRFLGGGTGRSGGTLALGEGVGGAVPQVPTSTAPALASETGETEGHYEVPTDAQVAAAQVAAYQVAMDVVGPDNVKSLVEAAENNPQWMPLSTQQVAAIAATVLQPDSNRAIAQHFAAFFLDAGEYQRRHQAGEFKADLGAHARIVANMGRHVDAITASGANRTSAEELLLQNARSILAAAREERILDV